MTGIFESILKWIYGLVGNYGVAVVIFTVLIRLLITPLDFKSRKGMRAMSRVQPKMQELQKKYKNDQEKLNRKMAELYKAEKVSPMSGCLPMIIQLVLMIFMFNAMRNLMFNEIGTMMYGLFNELAAEGAEAVERIAPQGFLWIKNIFQPDSFGAAVLPNYEAALQYIKNAGIEYTAPEGLDAIYNAYVNMHYGADQFMTLKILLFNVTVPTSMAALTTYANGLFILPVFAALSQILMTRLTGQQTQQVNADPNQPNPMNNGMMKWFFPLFSLYICATQNAAFSVYWAVANIIAIIQNLAMNKYFSIQDKKAAQQETIEIQ